MDKVLQGLVWQKCLVYLDDVIIFGRTFEESLNNLVEILDRFRQGGLILKAKKCTIFATEIQFLGHIISEEGVKCDPEKIQAINDWPTPTNS